MSIDKEDLAQEQKHLDDTIEIIKEQIENKKEKCQMGYKEATELAKYHWEHQNNMDIVDKANSYGSIERNATITNEQARQLRRLYKALDEPFFGKITITIDGEKEEYHIGITSVSKDLDFFVNDWRSPIASIFYNSRLGDTKFKVPNGFVSCNLEQRKQIRVRNGKVTRIVNSDVHISDDELQEVLSKSNDGKMKNIVTTIQEEQNDIIRNLKDRHIIVQGCAGSGKTSVALHRLAYLLYNDDKSTSENMLIFSPSDVFSSYISSVLPDLGENNVLQTTFSDFANAFVKRFDKIESYIEFVSRYYDGLNSEKDNKLNQFKFSNDYIKALDAFIKRKSDAYRFRDDLVVGNLTVPKDFMNKLVESENNLSLQEKINSLTDEVGRLTKKDVIKKSQIRNIISKELVKPAFDPRALYNEFLSSPEFIETYGTPGNKLNKKLLEYPDLIGLLYLNFEMSGYPNNTLIHHLVIDETQDYGPLQMKMIVKMFGGATITALGDANQTINPYHKYDTLESMKKYMGKETNYIELNKAYRSSKEIMEYTSDLVDNHKIEPVRVSMNNPVQKKIVSKENLFTQLVSDILNLREQGLNRVCVITKSTKEAKAIYEGLKDTIPDLVIINEELDKDSNLLVSTSYMAKGLEFDAVINYNSEENPYNESDKYLYYVACTRAQHNLVIYNEPEVKKKGLVMC